jgi:hypothetical protein
LGRTSSRSKGVRRGGLKKELPLPRRERIEVRDLYGEESRFEDD